MITQSPFVVIGLIVGVAAFIGVTRYPQWGLYLMVLSVPGQAYVSISLGGSRVTFTQLAVLLAVLGWVGSRVIYRQPFIPQPIPRLVPFYLIYLSVMVLSMTVATSTSASLDEFSRWLIASFAYLLATSVINTRRQIWELAICLCAGSIIEGIIGAAQSKLQSGPEGKYLPCIDSLRACGTFIMPNSYAGYVEMALPLIVALALMAWSNRTALMQKWFWSEGKPRDHMRPTLWKSHAWLLLIPASGISLLGILTAQSKGAFLGLGVATIVMTLLVGRKAIPLIILGGLALFLLVAGVQTGVVPPSTFGRLVAFDQFTPFDVRDVVVTDDNFSTVERMAMWQAGGNMFLSDPWLGVGIGNYNTRYFEFSTPQWPISRGHAHNYYIQAAAETGIIGAVAYVVLLLVAIGQGWQTVKQSRSDRMLWYIAWGAFGIIIAVAVHNLVEDLHVLNMGIQWSTVLALFYIIQQQLKMEKARN